jgi:SAM-dependent methyltransferase
MDGPAQSADSPAVESVKCDLCGSDASAPYGRYNPPAPAPERVVQCSECGLVYTNPRPTPSRLAAMYASYHALGIARVERRSGGWMQRMGRIMFLRRLWHWYCGQYLGEVLSTARGRVLDVGCGTGDLMEDLKALGCEPYGIEPSADAVQSCLDRGLQVQMGVLEDVDFPDGFFDCVVMWNALEHIPSPLRGLRKIGRMLRTGGKVFIFVPNVASYMALAFGHHWIGWHMPFHFHHFSTTTMRRLAHESGLGVVRLRTVTPEYAAGYSLRAWLSARVATACADPLCAVTRMAAFRLSIPPLMRTLDACLPGQGEFLAVELVKPDDGKQ